jgi:pyruvate dehydrogenase E1 component alpha subunit
MRRVETVSQALYQRREIRGFLHLYNGQEAVASGLEASITKDDHVITAYRCHAHLLSDRCGTHPKEVLAELTGRSGGCAQGKGGSMHMYNAKTNFYGGNGIVGAQVPLGTGLAFAQKYNKTGRVCMTYYGDGAANQGQIFESYNIAKVWNLPVIFICENNKYAMGTPVERASATQDFYTRGHYIPGIAVDGMDVLAMKAVGKFAVEFVKKNGPIIIEAETYRYKGHSMSDPGISYRKKEEVTEMEETKDPIKRVAKLLLENGLAKEEELVAIENEINEVVKQAVEYATTSPPPAVEEQFTDILTYPLFTRGRELTTESYVPKH